MLLIPCPHCGPRAEIEFVCGGEVNERPVDPAVLDPRAWTTFVFTRSNVLGLIHERWWHAHGCRRWFVIERNTSSNAITAPGSGKDRS